jgi:hypothetical protein
MMLHAVLGEEPFGRLAMAAGAEREESDGLLYHGVIPLFRVPVYGSDVIREYSHRAHVDASHYGEGANAPFFSCTFRCGIVILGVYNEFPLESPCWGKGGGSCVFFVSDFDELLFLNKIRAQYGGMTR